MKIAQLAVSPTSFLHLKGPDGNYLYEDKEPVGIDLYSPGSPEAAIMQERASARMLKRMQDNDGKITMAPAAQARVELAQDLATVTAGFHHIEHDGDDGKPLSGENLHRAVYSDPAFGWLRDQVQKMIGDWSRFTPGSATG